MINCFDLCLYKTSRKKYIFLYKNVNNNNSHQAKTTCTFLYIEKANKLPNSYIYIQKACHFAKSQTICVAFLFTKSQTLYVTQFFMSFLRQAFIYIQKPWNFALRHIYIYIKPDTPKIARQIAVRFLIYKTLTLCVMLFFMEFLKLAEGGGAFLYTKTFHFALIFYFPKTMPFLLRFFINKARKFVSHFYMKTNSLCVTFLYLKFIIQYILIPNYKHKYNQSNQTDK